MNSSVQRYSAPPPVASSGSQNLADILERVLDKGIVIAGDVQINLLDIELLTIKLRLLIASVDKAQEIGIDWWAGDPFLNRDAKELQRENEMLRDRLDRLESQEALPESERQGDSEPADDSDTAKQAATDHE
jgi:Gas vesicle protein